MIKLENLHVELGKKIFTPKDRKYLRVSISNIVKNIVKPATIINESSLSWDEEMTLPILFKQQFSFEIYDKHQFGYNPQELGTILKGTLRIENSSETHNMWEIISTGNKKIGYLSANIVIQSTQSLAYDPKDPKQEEQKRTLRIKSIVAHVKEDIKNKKGFVKIRINDQSVDTAVVKSRNGQLVFIEPYEIQKSQSQNQAQIAVYSLQKKSQSKLLGSGKYQLIGNTPPRKVILTKDHMQVGQIFIDGKIMKARDKKISSSSRIMDSNSSLQTIQESFVYDRKKSPKSIDFTRLQHFGISSSRTTKPILDYSQISSVSKKKVSVLSKNSDIIFPKEKRFNIYQDRQTDRITYLNDRSMEFKDPHSEKFYRGASIGYGGKTDFRKATMDTPGVGNYRLPSIWDRY